MTLSKYDTDFANAMALKLRLNREARQLRRLNEFRLEIVKKTISRHPRATVETILQMMDEMGFQVNGEDCKTVLLNCDIAAGITCIMKQKHHLKVCKRQKGLEMAECGCGRSPNAKCVGWHDLTEEKYLEKKAAYEAKQAAK